jgi:uncharacterized protein with ATP-grasp and redox domains
MLMIPECISCILDDVVSAAALLTTDKEKQSAFARKFVKSLSDLDYNKTPSYYITNVHRLLKAEIGQETLFREKRKICNEVGIRISERIEKQADLKKGYHRFSFLVKWAIAGNRLDFRTAGEGYTFSDEDIEEMLRASVANGVAVDDLAEIWRFLQERPKVLYVLDNVGEIAFDKLLLKFLKEFGCQTTAALRSGAITSDATLQDGIEVGIDQVADDTIIACPDTLGISFEEATPEFLNALNQTDLVISKGQANYYAFSEKEHQANYRIAYFLTTKCEPVSNAFGKSGKVNVAKFI